MQIKFYFKWFDFWIGWFYDAAKRRLYIGLLPMIGIQIQLKRYTSDSNSLNQILRDSTVCRMFGELESAELDSDGTIHISPKWIKAARASWESYR
jgi:hypothetical protein